jgi:hypothetical protein
MAPLGTDMARGSWRSLAVHAFLGYNGAGPNPLRKQGQAQVATAAIERAR